MNAERFEWINGTRYRDGHRPGVYMVKVGREIKIGCTGERDQRLRDFGSGRRLIAWADIRGAQRRFAVEQALHEAMEQIAIISRGNEWYWYRPSAIRLLLPMFSQSAISSYLRIKGLTEASEPS